MSVACPGGTMPGVHGDAQRRWGSSGRLRQRDWGPMVNNAYMDTNNTVSGNALGNLVQAGTVQGNIVQVSHIGEVHGPNDVHMRIYKSDALSRSGTDPSDYDPWGERGEYKIYVRNLLPMSLTIVEVAMLIGVPEFPRGRPRADLAKIVAPARSDNPSFPFVLAGHSRQIWHWGEEEMRDFSRLPGSSGSQFVLGGLMITGRSREYKKYNIFGNGRIPLRRRSKEDEPPKEIWFK